MTIAIIGGHSVTDLKALREAIQQDAAKFIAESIAEGTALVDQLVELDESEYDKAGEVAAKAVECFENAEVVSGISGVKYSIPFYEEYSDDRPMSQRVEDCTGRIYDHEAVDRLYSVLEDMESECKAWYSSNC